MTDTGADFTDQLPESISRPVDMRFRNWVRSTGLPNNVWPSLAYAAYWEQMTEDEKDRFV